MPDECVPPDCRHCKNEVECAPVKRPNGKTSFSVSFITLVKLYKTGRSLWSTFTKSRAPPREAAAHRLRRAGTARPSRRAGAPPLKTARTAQPTIGKHIANPNHTDIPKRGSLNSFSPRRERHFRVNTRSAVREKGLSDTSRTALHDTRRCRPHPRLTNRNCRRGYFRAVRRDCRASSPPKRSSSEVRT